MALTRVKSLLINNEKQSEKSDPVSFRAALIPPCLTTAHRAACIPVFISAFIHLRKYHPKPHLSCISCSLTFHFVWQTLIFTSKVLSRRHPTRAYLLCQLCKGWKEMWEHQHHPIKTNPTLIQGSRTQFFLVWVIMGAAINGDLSINSSIPLMHLQRNHDSYQTPCTLIKEG